jgi:prepilin-type processing-associated H-X9-DG protein
MRPYLQCEAILLDPGFSWVGPPAKGTKLADYTFFTWGPGGRGTREDPYWRWPGPPLCLAQVRRPTETLTLMDGYTTTQATWSGMARHGLGMNAGFVDGHVRWLPPGRPRASIRTGAALTGLTMLPSIGERSRRTIEEEERTFTHVRPPFHAAMRGWRYNIVARGAHVDLSEPIRSVTC